MDKDEWNRFCSAPIWDYEGLTNFTISFKELTKRYAKGYMQWIRAAFLAKDDMTDDEFCNMNLIPMEVLKKWTN